LSYNGEKDNAYPVHPSYKDFWGRWLFCCKEKRRSHNNKMKEFGVEIYGYDQEVHE